MRIVSSMCYCYTGIYIVRITLTEPRKRLVIKDPAKIYENITKSSLYFFPRKYLRETHLCSYNWNSCHWRCYTCHRFRKEMTHKVSLYNADMVKTIEDELARAAMREFSQISCTFYCTVFSFPTATTLARIVNYLWRTNTAIFTWIRTAVTWKTSQDTFASEQNLASTMDYSIF